MKQACLVALFINHKHFLLSLIGNDQFNSEVAASTAALSPSEVRADAAVDIDIDKTDMASSLPTSMGIPFMP